MFNLNAPSTPNGIENLTLKFTKTAPRTDRVPPPDWPARYTERAEIIREKGTSRAQLFRGEIDKYAWIDIGSSYLPSEIVAAFLLAQLENIHELTNRRKEIWSRYHQGLEDLELAGFLKRPVIPPSCDHNGHLYYLVMPIQTPARS